MSFSPEKQFDLKAIANRMGKGDAESAQAGKKIEESVDVEKGMNEIAAEKAALERARGIRITPEQQAQLLALEQQKIKKDTEKAQEKKQRKENDKGLIAGLLKKIRSM